MRRRDFLRLGGAGLLLLGGGRTLRAAEDEVELVFSFGPDDTGVVRRLVEDFNAQHKGRIRVVWREGPRETDDYFDRLRSDLMVESSEVDVIGADSIWTAELAHHRWVADLSSRFHRDYDADAFLHAALNSADYRARIWAVPWYTDVGMLFYRRDLLSQSGYEGPPRTWSELEAMAARVQADSRVPYGYVFQGAQYEGAVTNAVEFIWNAGGKILTGNLSFSPQFGMNVGNVIDPNVITVDSAAAARGLESARHLVAGGTAPPQVTGFHELESMRAFLAGEAVFMRNWPYVFGHLSDPQARVTIDQIGVGAIPVEGNQRSRSCLGGWNLMINAFSHKQDAAWTFIRYATDPARQRTLALDGGFLPVLRSLYEDPEIVQRMPAVALGRRVIDNARVRPVSPFYSQMSPRIAKAFNQLLRGDLSADDAVRRLKRELETILRANR